MRLIKFFICFIDFAQAYDSIWRKGAWEILKKYGIHQKIIRLVENLYSIVLAKIRVEGEESDWFQIETGFRQGCILSPILFNIILDYILRRMEKEHNLGKTSVPPSMQDAEYADDTYLMAECIIKVMELVEAFNEESKKMGLRINTKKTKVMPITEKCGPWPQLIIDGEEIETVKKFIYLGSEITAEGGTEHEIKRRKALAGSTFQRLNERIFRRHDIGLKVKLRVLNAFVIPILVYGSESWIMTKTMTKSLDACENSWLRRILRISYKDHITNETVRKRTGQEYVSNVIKRRRLKWAGHMMRMENTRAVKRSWKYQLQGKR